MTRWCLLVSQVSPFAAFTFVLWERVTSFVWIWIDAVVCALILGSGGALTFAIIEGFAFGGGGGGAVVGGAGGHCFYGAFAW